MRGVRWQDMGSSREVVERVVLRTYLLSEEKTEMVWTYDEGEGGCGEGGGEDKSWGTAASRKA